MDATLAASGEHQLAELAASLDVKLGDDARPGGLAASLTHGPVGTVPDGVHEYRPGADSVQNLSVLHTLASGRPMTHEVLSDASPSTVHVALDLPERMKSLTGQYTAQSLGFFTLALATRIAVAAGANVSVYHNDGSRAALVQKEVDASGIRKSVRMMDGRLDRRPVTASQPGFTSLLAMMRQHMDFKNDIGVVVSDFTEGFDPENGTFTWEENLKAIARQANDTTEANRLWAVRIKSPAHHTLPSGVVEGLSIEDSITISRQAQEIYGVQQARQQAVLNGTRRVDVGTNRNEQRMHPARVLTKFIIGHEIR